jgi:integrase
MTNSIDKTSDYLTTEELRKLNRYFQNQKNYSMALLIEFGFRTLLRFSDLERFKWEDILDMDELTLNEKKTKKRRAIKVGGVLKDIISKT